LVGPNGAGKTTLFSMILGNEGSDAGKVILERGVTLGYLPQESAPIGDETVSELATSITPEFTKLRRIIMAWDADHPVEASHPEEIHDDVHNRFHELGGYQIEAKAKQILVGLGFKEKDFARPARELSGGWVMRAHLARLLVQEPDLLMLDEPTNHLDLETLIWFQEYLIHYPGAILVISHDREFLQGLSDKIFEFRDGRMKEFLGDINEYLEFRQKESIREVSAEKSKLQELRNEPAPKVVEKPIEKKVEIVSKDQKNLQNKIKKVEEKISDLELKIEEMEASFTSENPSEETLEIYNSKKAELD